MTIPHKIPSRPDSERSLPEQLADAFEQAGARLEYHAPFQERYHLDFTITRFEQLFAHVNLGVHITTRGEDLTQLDTFSQVAKRGMVLKALYIEIDPETVHAGGLLVAYGACLSYLFDRRYSQVRAIGLRINEDCSFQFFDLDEAVERLRRISLDEDLSIGEDMEGRIIAYFTDKGFGFIQTDDDRKFFFHIANIVDDELRARLPSYIPGEIIPVDFQYGGNDGKKYPKAINVAFPEE